MGGLDCEMVNQTSGELYYLDTDSRSLKCYVTSKFIGPMNGTTYVTERGVSQSRKWGTYSDSQDKLFQHHTYAGKFDGSKMTVTSMNNKNEYQIHF